MLLSGLCIVESGSVLGSTETPQLFVSYRVVASLPFPPEPRVQYRTVLLSLVVRVPEVVRLLRSTLTGTVVGSVSVVARLWDCFCG